jgi:hypothetical protein
MSFAKLTMMTILATMTVLTQAHAEKNDKNARHLCKNKWRTYSVARRIDHHKKGVAWTDDDKYSDAMIAEKRAFIERCAAGMSDVASHANDDGNGRKGRKHNKKQQRARFKALAHGVKEKDLGLFTDDDGYAVGNTSTSFQTLSDEASAAQ